MSKFKAGDVLYFIGRKNKVAHRRCKLKCYDNFLWFACPLGSSATFWIESRNLFTTRADAQAECDKRNNAPLPKWQPTGTGKEEVKKDAHDYPIEGFVIHSCCGGDWNLLLGR